MLETANTQNPDSNPKNFQCNDIVQHEGLMYVVTNIEGKTATIHNVMDFNDRKEGVKFSELTLGGYGYGNETEEKQKSRERTIARPDSPAFDNYLLRTKEDVQKCVAMLTRDVIEGRRKKLQELPEFFSLQTKLVVDNEGEIYNIEAFDSEGLDLTSLKTGDTFPYDYGTFERLFSPFNPEGNKN